MIITQEVGSYFIKEYGKFIFFGNFHRAFCNCCERYQKNTPVVKYPPLWLSLTCNRTVYKKKILDGSDCIYISSLYVLYSCPYLLSCNFIDHKGNVFLNSLSHWSQLKCTPSWTDFACSLGLPSTLYHIHHK